MKTEREIMQAKTNAASKLQHVYHGIVALGESIVPLYDAIEGFFFQDVDYHMFDSMLPPWMVYAGRSPESSIDKETYEKLRIVYNDPLSNRVIHWIDVQVVMAAFQDRVLSVNNYLMDIFEYLPAYCLYNDDEYESCNRGIDDTSDHVYNTINNVFVSLCSSFDLFTKIVFECSHYNINNFTEYTKLKSRKENILYKKGNYGYDDLKAEGQLYSEPPCIRTACSFRDEFIHNGAWDYRCAIYYPFIDGNPVESFMVMPDIDDLGHLVTSGSRNKFYTKSNKINVFLPSFVEDVTNVLSRTVTSLKDVLRKNTTPLPQSDRDKNTTDYIELLSARRSNLDIIKKKYDHKKGT